MGTLVEARDVDGALQQYEQAISKYDMSSPTFFAPMINQFLQTIAQESEGKEYTYHTILILSDGQNHDMSETIAMIIRASRMPVSLIIIGIGAGNFDQEQLDADNALLSLNAQVQERDNVQFVPFRDFPTTPDHFVARFWRSFRVRSRSTSRTEG